MGKIVQDDTAIFCDRFLSARYLTHDQMIHQINSLLDRQLRALEKSFLAEGGFFTENLYRMRSEKRKNELSSI